MDTFLTEIQVTFSALKILRVWSHSNEEELALVALVERTHCTTFEHQWTIVLIAIYSAILSEYLFAIKALWKHFLSDRQLSNLICINFCKYLIHFLLHLTDLILLRFYYLSVLFNYLLERFYTVVLVLCHDRAWDTCKATLGARYCQFLAIGVVGEPVWAGEGGVAAIDSADHRDLQTFFWEVIL